MKVDPHVLFGVVVLTLFVPWQLRGDERDDRIRALEKRVEQLEKLLLERDAKPVPGSATPEPTAVPKPAPTLSIGASGFTMGSAQTAVEVARCSANTNL